MKQHDPRASAPAWRVPASPKPASRAIVGGLPWAAEPPGSAVNVGLPGIAVDLPPADIPSGPRRVVGRSDRLRGRLAAALRESPAFSISLSLHCLLLLLMALWVVRTEPVKRLKLRLSFGPAAKAGDGKDVGPPRETPEPPVEERMEIARADLPTVVMPISVPVVESPVEPRETPAPQPRVAPAVGMLLSGREAGRKEALLGAAGGGDDTEKAVAAALEWLKRQQGDKDGLWSLMGPYQDGGSQENRLAATAMALLAFQGAGITTEAGPHRAVVARGWKRLLELQQQDGSFDVGELPHLHALYSHAQATMAICELYGLTRDPRHGEHARRALAYCVAAQGPNGGWKYEPGKPGDMSVTGWYMMALKTAEMAGLDVPAETFARLGEFLDSVAVEDGARYGYMRYSTLKAVTQVTAAVTAEGLLCRQFLGWPQRDPRLVRGLELVMAEKPITFKGDSKDVYAWYYITQVAHHMEGEPWGRWNERLRTELPLAQATAGRERGSWDPSLDRWGRVGGRLFVTCFCTWMLETYYRHLPLYAAPARER
jgi:hypothetical protein